jgi:hypothetical protein
MRRGQLVALVVVAACSKSKSAGLPAATEWSATNVAPGVQLEEPADTDPHAGLDMSGVAGAAAQQGNDDDRPPDTNAPAAPNAGVATNAAAMAPDPNRPIDPSHRISGVVRVTPKLAAQLVANPLFLSVRRPDASGNPSGGLPIATQKLQWTSGSDSVGFELTDRDAMVNITDTLSGDVVVVAHYDTDGEPTTRTSGDVIGTKRVTVPAEKVVVVLDTVVP